MPETGPRTCSAAWPMYWSIADCVIACGAVVLAGAGALRRACVVVGTARTALAALAAITGALNTGVRGAPMIPVRFGVPALRLPSHQPLACLLCVVDRRRRCRRARRGRGGR